MKRLRQNSAVGGSKAYAPTALSIVPKGAEEKEERAKKREERRLKKAAAAAVADESAEKRIKRQKKLGMKCIETHAELSGSDSGDEDLDEDFGAICGPISTFLSVSLFSISVGL